MDFADRVLLKLATPAGRNALLGQQALAGMVATAFDATTGVQGPYAIDVERLDLGIEITRPILIEGSYTTSPGSVPGELRLRASNVRGASLLRADALWRGQLVARRVPQDDLVTDVAGGFTALDLDREIIEDLGALPAGAALETERRQRLLARLRAGAAQAGVIDENSIDAMLAASGVADVDALLAGRSVADIARFTLKFSPAVAGGTPVPIRLPVTVAVIVRQPPLGLTTLLADSQALRAALADDPAAQPAAATLRRRVPILLLWVLPETAFDDTDWPGADRAARIANATDLLSDQGIAMVTA